MHISDIKPDTNVLYKPKDVLYVGVVAKILDGLPRPGFSIRWQVDITTHRWQYGINTLPSLIIFEEFYTIYEGKMFLTNDEKTRLALILKLT